MKSKALKNISKVTLATALTIGIVSPDNVASAAQATQSAKPSAISKSVLGKVNIDSKSYFELHDVNLLSDSTGNTVSFKVTIHNKGNSDIQLIDYWIYLKSKSGSKFTVNLVPEDRTKARVTANSSLTLTYYSNVSSQIKLTDLKFDFIKWDFSVANYERTLGSLSIPSSYRSSTPVNQKRSLSLDGTTLLTSIERVVMSKTDKYYRPTFSFKIENTGKQSFTVPAYEYKLITAQGLVYPLTVVKGKDELVLNPKFSETIQLTGSVPVDVEFSGWTLLVTLPVAETKISIPVSSYAVPPVSQQDDATMGKEYGFSTASGDYVATLNSVHRLPLEDNDILAANITLSNPGPETLKIPDLLGEFVLDQNIKVPASAVRSDKSIGIPPKSSVSLQLYANIPYNYEFTDIKTVLQEKEEEDKVADLLEFTSSANFSSIKTVSSNEKYKFDVVNKRANLSVRDVFTYESDSSNIISVQMIADNLEKRYSDITALNAYFQTDDGTLYPASVQVSENKVAPGGSALINFWKGVPKEIDANKVKFVVGEAIIGEDGKPTSNYVNPVGFILPPEDMTIASELNDLNFYPFTLSLNQINTQVDLPTETIITKFNYELKQNILIQSNTDEHKIVFEILDEDNKLQLSQEYLIGSGENSLLVGSHEEKFTKSGSNLYFKLESMRYFNFNVYHQFNGHKKLIASKQVRWFTTTE
ncbi:hypothetical protein ACF3MZ_21705 [Paenibacillaceae bacterium WGS1546]|uniref:hypothetical protein n=1 Tax=Cohnella sp. WGS1546 TaxID=3366810 RepID=UPI00372CF14A